MHRSKTLNRTLIGFILLVGLSASIFLSSLASVRAAPQLAKLAPTPTGPTHTPTSTRTPTPTRTPTRTPTSIFTPTTIPTQNYTPCAPSTSYPFPSLVINEIGWAGTSYSSSDQWVELYNDTACAIVLDNHWDLVGANIEYNEGNFTISLMGTIPSGGYFVIASNDSVFTTPNFKVQPSSLLVLNDNYESLQLQNDGYSIDTANASYHSCPGFYYLSNYCWPAGSTTNYASMERYYPPGGKIRADGSSAWVTFAGPTTNTPLDRNGNHVHGTPGGLNWAWTVTETPSPVPTATRKPTPTFAPTPIPAVVINEILPRPGSDWNGDGVIDNHDEFIEVENLGPGVATLTSWKLEVVPSNGSNTFTLPSLKLNPNGRAVFFGSTTHLLLEDSGETVSLIDTHGVIEDAFTYPAVLQPDDSWCRIRDGIGNWQDGCFPTPGFENALSGILPAPPPPQPGQAAACLLPDVAPAAFRLAECNGFGADIWNQQYWNDLSGQNEYQLPDPNSKGITFIQ